MTCPDGLQPDGDVCPRCSGPRALFARGGKWVHHPRPHDKNGALTAAAVAFRESLVPRADELRHGVYPLWYGWAIYDAFVAGAQYAASAARSFYCQAGGCATQCVNCADEQPASIPQADATQWSERLTQSAAASSDLSHEALANRLANLLPFTTPPDQMPTPWEEDRSYNDTEIERLYANKRVMAMMPEIVAALRAPVSATRRTNDDSPDQGRP